MKKTLLFIASIGLLTLLNAQMINECKIDVYYGNGVWNEYEDAEDSRDELYYTIKKEIINNDPKLQAKYGEVKLAYNWGQWQVLDVLEVYYQLHEAGQLEGVGYFTAISILAAGFPEVALGAIATQKLMETYTSGWEQGNVNEMWENYYNESFKLGHRVLLVSHSQGNMFANRIHDTITPTEYRNYFANLQVASPASEVKASKGDYVTLFGDPIINPIPGSMDGNANGSPGHAFVNAYLGQFDPYTKIVTNMKQLLPTLDSEISQWQIDQEQDRGTMNYRITVKHRFDPSVIMNEEVYPFAPSKKLYKVDDEYVKASCGGEKILASWEGQEDSEFYKLQGTMPAEYIIVSNRVFYIVSVDHAFGGLGMYFNFYVDQVDEIMGSSDWNDHVFTIRNDRTDQVSQAVLWRSPNGGSIGNGHGRWDDGTAASGQWQAGDNIRIMSLNIYPRAQ